MLSNKYKLHNVMFILIINRHSYNTQYGWEIKAIMDGASARKKKKKDLIYSKSEKTID